MIGNRQAGPHRRCVAIAAAVAAAVAVGGCGQLDSTASQALDSGAKASSAAATASRELMHKLCPAADGNGAHLTPAQATACVKRATKAYLDFLKACGFDPQKIANGSAP